MERSNKSQTEIAESLNKSKAYVSQLLNGARNMTLRTLADIADVLETKIEIRLADTHAQAHWQPLDCARVVRLRPEADLKYVYQNDSVNFHGVGAMTGYQKATSAILAGGFAFLLAGLLLRKGRKLELPAA